LRLITIWPFSDEHVIQVRKQVKRIVVPEMNLGPACPRGGALRFPARGKGVQDRRGAAHRARNLQRHREETPMNAPEHEHCLLKYLRKEILLTA